MPIWLTIVVTVLGSAGCCSLIQFFVSRHDKKKEKKEEKHDGIKADIDSIKEGIQELKDKADIQEKDNCRTQLLVLIADYSQDKSEIMRLGEHYFDDLDANWYMSSIFTAWLKANNIERPAWFKGV